MGEKTPVMILQEISQKSGWLPNFETISVEGPSHNGTFTMRVRVGEHEGIGSGSTKKKAKHIAALSVIHTLAAEGLVPEKVLAELMDMNPDVQNDLPGNPVGELHEFCLENHLPLSTYSVIRESGHPHNKTFDVELVLGPYKKYASAKCKKAARKRAAYEMMQHLKKLTPEELKPFYLVDDSEELQQSVNELKEFCAAQKLPEPLFSFERTVTVKCYVAGIEKVVCAAGLEAAKKQAAKDMLEVLQNRDSKLGLH